MANFTQNLKYAIAIFELKTIFELKRISALENYF